MVGDTYKAAEKFTRLPPHEWLVTHPEPPQNRDSGSAVATLRVARFSQVSMLPDFRLARAFLGATSREQSLC
jgi:hypothetical protein